MLEVGSSRGSAARFSIQQFIAKSLQMCGKGHGVLLQQLSRKQRSRPNPYSSSQSCINFVSSTKVTTHTHTKTITTTTTTTKKQHSCFKHCKKTPPKRMHGWINWGCILPQRPSLSCPNLPPSCSLKGDRDINP